ncbi:uncharacterized protein LOC126184107 [Schistocerca cancellata]|uniref:uncharacterized protein LOC126184107 n=1 Tax=Schistocerca cancellata TaxID=274614 RepID=UPI0021189EC1|nr:uncharacterized protein LOC126184107 [Schistocerca cancellata]
MADKVEADDSVKLVADKKGSDCNTPEEGMGQTYSGQFDSKQDAERGATPIPEQVPTSTIRLEGTRLLSIIPVKVKTRKYQESIGTCSPFSPEPLEDCKLSTSVFPSPGGTAAAVGGESSGFASAKDEQLAVAEETKSNDSFVVVKDGNEDVEIKEDKEEKETATPGGTSATEPSTATSRKKKGGISALTLALQMEKAKQAAAQQAAAQQAAEGASGSELKNDTGNEGGTSIQQNTLPRPVRTWGPDGRPIVQENDQDSNFRADELVTPLVFRLCEDGRVRCFFEVPMSRDVTPDSDPPMGPDVDEILTTEIHDMRRQQAPWRMVIIACSSNSSRMPQEAHLTGAYWVQKARRMAQPQKPRRSRR